LVGGGALTPDASMLFLVDVVGDAVGVVGGEQLAFLVVESGNLGAGSGGLLVGECGEVCDVSLDGGADALLLLVVELNGGIVALTRN